MTYTRLRIIGLLALLGGCNASSPDTAKQPTSPAEESRTVAEGTPAPAAVETATPHVIDAEKLLANRLSDDLARQGWVRLFDGRTLFGWRQAGNLDWKVVDGTLQVEAGEKGLLCTNTRWRDYELTLEYKASADTNSGVFLRTPLFPTDPAVDCYELNIAPPDNPFPTGSLVKRKRADASTVGDLDAEAWHRYEIRLEGGHLNIKLNGNEVLDYTDPMPLPAGLIGLQFNSGSVAFRDIRIRPLGLTSLVSETIEDNWKRYPEMEGDFQMTQDGLHITGGRAQLESQGTYDDFVLLTEVRTNAAALNSGIFFRCIPGDVMMGYECQISNAMSEGNPLFPVDCGTGGFFRRQDARIVAAEDMQWFSMLLVADGSTFASWVNGLQVCEWTDTRDPDPNPRKGKRLEAGTLMLQAHDPTTDIHMRQLSVASLDASKE
ncbi:MAG: DUF1080 domain-containing protein [Pirellulaceae bacterium]